MRRSRHDGLATNAFDGAAVPMCSWRVVQRAARVEVKAALDERQVRGHPGGLLREHLTSPAICRDVLVGSSRMVYVPPTRRRSSAEIASSCRRTVFLGRIARRPDEIAIRVLPFEPGTVEVGRHEHGD